MGLDNYDFNFEQNDDGSYRVISKWHQYSGGIPCIASESIFADEFITVKLGEYPVWLAKYQGQYSLYTKQYLGDLYSPYYHGLVKFLDGILEYHYFDKVFLYRTVDGWYFFFCPEAFWCIENPTVLKKRVEGITKLCEPDTQILEYKVLKLCPYEVHTTHYLYSNEVKESCETRYKYFGYMVKTSKGSFLLYKGNGCIYDVIPTYFIQMNRYSKVPGYEDLARIHPNKGRKFFLANLSYDHICKTYAEDLIQKITYLGDGYLLAQNGSKSKLLFCYDSFLPDTVVDWGVHSFTKVDSWKEDDSIVYTAWRVDDGESSYSIIHKYRDDAYLSIPKLKEKKKD